MLKSIRKLDRKIFNEYVRYHTLLDEAIGDAESVLDVGCGSGSPLQYLPRRFKRVVGADGFQPSLDRVRELRCHHELVKVELPAIGERFPPGSFDAVIALDVIEHFEKPDGLRLLATMERLARRRVVIFTPNGFLPQGEFDNNPYQVHRSGWSVAEMRELGFRVYGVNGWKPLLGEYANIRFRPSWFWRRALVVTQPIVQRLPDQAFQILCVKELSGERAAAGNEAAPTR